MVSLLYNYILSLGLQKFSKFSNSMLCVILIRSLLQLLANGYLVSKFNAIYKKYYSYYIYFLSLGPQGPKGANGVPAKGCHLSICWPWASLLTSGI